MKLKCLVISIALIELFLSMRSGGRTSVADEVFWPQFRGPNGSGVAAPEANPPIRFGPELNVVWKAPVQSGCSSPCIWGNKIFLTGFDEQEQQLRTLCVDRSSGAAVWSRTVHTKQIEQVQSISSPATATPATDGERIYVYFGSYGLLSYDFQGELQWSLPLPVPHVRFGSGASPIVVGDLVILNRDESGGSNALAVDRRDGRTIWTKSQATTSPLGASSYSTPVAWRDQVVFHRVDEIVAHSVEDGKRVWSVKAATAGESTPVVAGDTLFVAAWTNFGEPEFRVELPDFQTLLKQHDQNADGKISRTEFPGDLLAAVRPEIGDLPGSRVHVKPYLGMIDGNNDGLIDPKDWDRALVLVATLYKEHGLMAIGLGGTGDVTITNVRWQEKKSVPEVPSPLYYDGRVYMVKNGGVISCMEAKSGTLIYRERLGAGGPYYSSPIAAHGRIYITSQKGVMSVLAAGDNLHILSTNDLREQVMATPAIVGNVLYVRTARHLYAFGE
jgi:outer membrane protein assembly factor BamB